MAGASLPLGRKLLHVLIHLRGQSTKFIRSHVDPPITIVCAGS
jgi:hypothetical protein